MVRKTSGLCPAHKPTSKAIWQNESTCMNGKVRLNFKSVQLRLRITIPGILLKTPNLHKACLGINTLRNIMPYSIVL
jgi:hypothetical protein